MFDGQFFPGQAIQFEGGFVRPPARLAFVDSATALSSVTITGPAGIVSGDVLILYDRTVNGSAPPATAVVPTGFNIIVNVDDSAGDNVVRAILSAKIADGSEASASLTGMDASGTNEHKILFVFRPNRPITSLVAASAAGEVTNGNPASQSVLAGSGRCPLVVIACYAGVGGTRTFSPSADGSATVSFLEMRYKIYNREAANVTVGMDDEGARNTMISAYFMAF